jgi:hypothetical protein
MPKFGLQKVSAGQLAPAQGAVRLVGPARELQLQRLASEGAGVGGGVEGEQASPLSLRAVKERRVMVVGVMMVVMRRVMLMSVVRKMMCRWQQRVRALSQHQRATAQWSLLMRERREMRRAAIVMQSKM